MKPVRPSSSVAEYGGVVLGGVLLSLAAMVSPGLAQPVSEAKPAGELTPARPASIPLKPIGDMQIERPSLVPPTGPEALVPLDTAAPAVPAPETYDPSGRRDPFVAIIEVLQDRKEDPSLPPLQRVGLTEINLVGVVWGGYGYTAMVQTPDGKGYAIRRGTRMGPNNGVVTSITERGMVVVERFTDIYGKKQEREFVRLLHQKEGSE